MTRTNLICASLVTAGLGFVLSACFNQHAEPASQPKHPTPEKPEQGAWVFGTIKKAKDIYDGDTITLTSNDNAGVYKIRMWGVDAFELKQKCKIKEAIIPCGTQGRDRLREFVKSLPDPQIRCEVKGRDRYKRDLAQCFAGGVDLGRLLVREGLAIAYQNSPAYKASENEANTLRQGVWAGSFLTPQDWRKHCKPKPRGKASRPHECLM